MQLLHLVAVACLLFSQGNLAAPQGSSAAPAAPEGPEQVAAAAASAPALKQSKNSFEYMNAKYLLHTTTELVKRRNKDKCNIKTVHIRREW